MNARREKVGRAIGFLFWAGVLFVIIMVVAAILGIFRIGL